MRKVEWGWGGEGGGGGFALQSALLHSSLNCQPPLCSANSLKQHLQLLWLEVHPSSPPPPKKRDPKQKKRKKTGCTFQNENLVQHPQSPVSHLRKSPCIIRLRELQDEPQRRTAPRDSASHAPPELRQHPAASPECGDVTGQCPLSPRAFPGGVMRRVRLWSRELTLNVLCHTIPHKLCSWEVKDVHGLQSFVSTHSEESDSLLFVHRLQ